MTAIIEARDLTKYYGAQRGIDSLTFDVEPGEVFGFLGPNGAGKTTTMRILVDLLRPTGGSVSVFGLNAERDSRAIHSRTGYLPGDLGLSERVTAAEQFAYFANLRGGVDDACLTSLIERFELDATRPVRTLSRGNKQKVGIIQAFMHEPELLILDEPTSGLDPMMQQAFNDLVRERTARGATVFLSSHIMTEVESLCDRVGIIRDGSLVAVEDIVSIKARALRRVTVVFERYNGASTSASVFENATELARIEGVTQARVTDDAVSFDLRGEMGPVLRALASMDVRDLRVTVASLDDIFRGYYTRASEVTA